MIRIDDLPGAVAWYTEVLGTEPYFAKPSLEAPAYVEFRTGRMCTTLPCPPAPSGTGMSTTCALPSSGWWHSAATELEPPRDLGEPGWVIASVADPFGNVLGLMHSPHCLDILERDQA